LQNIDKTFTKCYYPKKTKQAQTKMKPKTYVIITSLLLISISSISCMNQETLYQTSIDLSDSNGEVAETTSTDGGSIASPTESPSELNGDDMKTPAPENIETLPGIKIFDFTGNEPTWYIVDDRVMGGVSVSSVEILDSEVLQFTGTMSLESNGGFSSTRSDWAITDLGGFDGVLLRVLGDGKSYRLRIRSSETGSEISYNALFETTPNTWKLVYIPFKDMVPTYRGFVTRDDPLNPASIGSFGFMLSDKQPGEFSLQVDWILGINEEALSTFSSN
jgi:monofunctional biosynthetic peptidoglycan transglycosylase